jgi:hypothetical protein
VEWLKEEFKIGIKDYCVYWFRKAQDHLDVGGRAGLVGTNSISQNRARGASLGYLLDGGSVITAAVSKQRWPGEAVVNVSIVNWIKRPLSVAKEAILDGESVDAITAALRANAIDVSGATRLASNRNKCFYGPIPSGRGFILSPEEAAGLLDRTDASYREVVRPYLGGEDIANDSRQSPTRFIIDFGLRTLEEAMSYPAALEIVQERVRPVRARARRTTYRERWWRFAEPLVAMREAVANLERYIGGTATGKRILFCWCDVWTCPSNAMNVFAFDDDFAMGILTSRIHTRWASAQSSTLRVDIRYTPTSAFGTFPWPTERLISVAETARRLITSRGQICVERNIGLTKLYNQIDDGAWTDLRHLHAELDEAVAAAYGWPSHVAHDPDESNRRLLELNRAIAAGEIEYRPFD